MADDDRTDRVEELTEATCRRHLAAETVGRIALVSDGRVEMFPVNYAMSDGDVVIRTRLGGALASLGERSDVVFEIDELDHRYQTGWSVVVHGHADRVTDPAAVEQLEALDIVPWAGGSRPDWIRIEPTDLTGRRIRWS
jgi:nitroimidazol reductase NimA-like FMN-containing flavoprotein (pyridoxamine 5'-phosphate oxidase superfamily)